MHGWRRSAKSIGADPDLDVLGGSGTSAGPPVGLTWPHTLRAPARNGRAREADEGRCGTRRQLVIGGQAGAPGRSVRRSVRRRGNDLLARAAHHLVEPGLGDVEGLVTGDAVELDRPQTVVVALVVADDARAALERYLDGEVGHRLDQAQVDGVGL